MLAEIVKFHENTFSCFMDSLAPPWRIMHDVCNAHALLLVATVSDRIFQNKSIRIYEP